MFLKVGSTPKKQRRLYLMKITLPTGMEVIKVGVSSGVSSKERLLQICSGIYDKYRSTPMIKLLRDREVDADSVFKYETILHQYFADYRYKTKKVFDGVTEMFVIPPDDAIQAYMAVIEGQVPDNKYVYREPEEDKLPDCI